MLQNEFGGAHPISISEYYRGAGLVPGRAPNLGIPFSGQISISQFYGTAGAGNSPVVVLADLTGFKQSTVGNVQCNFQLNPDGSYAIDSIGPNSGQWLSAGAASEVEVYAVASGAVSGAALNTWLNLGTTRSWWISRTLNGTSFANLNLTFRRTSDGAELDTANIWLEVYRGIPV